MNWIKKLDYKNFLCSFEECNAILGLGDNKDETMQIKSLKDLDFKINHIIKLYGYRYAICCDKILKIIEIDISTLSITVIKDFNIDRNPHCITIFSDNYILLGYYRYI